MTDLRESYTYHRVEATEGPHGVARMITYHRWSTGKTWYRSKPVPGKSLRREMPDTVVFALDGEVAHVGAFTVPRRIGEREVVGAGERGESKETQRVIVRCSCGSEDEITLGAWKFARQHGTRGCRRCGRKASQEQTRLGRVHEKTVEGPK